MRWLLRRLLDWLTPWPWRQERFTTADWQALERLLTEHTD